MRYEVVNRWSDGKATVMVTTHTDRKYFYSGTPAYLNKKLKGLGIKSDIR